MRAASSPSLPAAPSATRQSVGMALQQAVAVHPVRHERRALLVGEVHLLVDDVEARRGVCG